MFKKIIAFMLGVSIFTTQMHASIQSAEYVYSISTLLGTTKSIGTSNSVDAIDYSSLLNSMNSTLFNSNVDKVVLEIINKTVNEKITKKKRTEFIPKNANTQIDQSDSLFGKTFELDYSDDDGMYVGFIENHLSTVSRGYYIKKYSKFDKADGMQKDYIELGKANFVDDLANALYDYKLLTKSTEIQPLLLSYLNYQATYSKFTAPNSYIENSSGWNGLINMNSGDNSLNSIKTKLRSLKSPITTIEGRGFPELVSGTNAVFLEDGKVLNYRSKAPNEDLFTHISMANTFMANNNIKRGFMFQPINPMTNYKFKSHKKCSGAIVKECKYWQTLNYTGGLDVYTMSFLDESYMDDWKEITYNNSDIMTGSIVPPTMVPINSYGKLPSMNSENYGFLFSSNYAGSIGTIGTYKYPMDNIAGLKGEKRVVKSSTLKTKGFGILTLILAIIIIIVLVVITAGAFGAIAAAGVNAGIGVGVLGIQAAVASAIAFANVMMVASVVGVVGGLYVLANMHKGSDSGDVTGATAEELRQVSALSNTILAQGATSYGALELAESTVLNGLIVNTNNYNMDKNFMSNTYHDIASQHSKSNLSQMPKSYFGTQLGILQSMDENPKFWKKKHKTGIINGYKNGFFNDGKSMVTGGAYGSFYDMEVMFRDNIRNYIGY